MTRGLLLALSILLAPALAGAQWIEIGSPWGSISDVSTGPAGTFAACDGGLLRLDGEAWTLIPHGGAFGGRSPSAVLVLSGTSVLVGVGSALLRWDAASGFSELAQVPGATISDLFSPDGERVLVACPSDAGGAIRELVQGELREVRGARGDFRAFAAQSSREALAVGGDVARFDGRTFRAGGAAEVALHAVAFEGRRRAWAVARRTDASDGGVFVWDGRAMTRAAGQPRELVDARAIAVAGPADVIVASGDGLWRGGAAAFHRIGSAAGVRGLARVGDRVLAYGHGGLVGWVGDEGVIPAAPIGPMGVVTAIGGGSASSLLVADGSSVSRWDGSTWSRDPLPPASCATLGIAQIGGEILTACFQGVFRRGASGWAREEVSTITTNLMLVHRGELWFLGRTARRRVRPGTLAAVALPAGFEAMRGSASDARMVIVDREGERLLELRDGAWVPLSAPERVGDVFVIGSSLVAIGRTAQLHDGAVWRELAGMPDDGHDPVSIAATSTSDVWIVQHGGRVVRYDGARWRVEPTPFVPSGIHALGPDVVIVGADARIARYVRP